MSTERIPKGESNILLSLFYQGGFCTVQAIWDTAEIERLAKRGDCILAAERPPLSVYVRRTKGSQKITRNLTVEIVDRWLKGEYMRVQQSFIPGFPDTDWMS